MPNYQGSFHVCLIPGQNESVDALLSSWQCRTAYAFPPKPLILRFLLRFLKESIGVVAIVPYWPRRAWFPWAVHLSTCHPFKIPILPRLLTQGRFVHPATPQTESSCLDVERQKFQSLCCSSEVNSTLLKARKPSTNCVYTKIWNKFKMFAASRCSDPAVPSSLLLLDFLQAGLNLGLSLSSLKVQVAAILAATQKMGRRHSYHPIPQSS